MKKMILAIALVAFVAFAGQAFGVNCANDNVPAATLLIPYFEADISDAACADPFAPTTFFAVNNASDEPVVAHVTYWTDYSVPEIDYDIYLTGYDVQVVNVRDVFCTGNLPQTSAALTAVGPFSFNTNGVGASCGLSAGAPPWYASPAITSNFQNHLRAIFTGQASPVNGLCGGSDIGTDLAHGYITIDASTDCNILFPDDAAYWTSGFPYTTELGNVLWGDYAYIDRNAGTSEGFTAVHIEAYAANIGGAGPTFYGRYTGVPATYTDGREPLPTTWAARYNVGAGFDGTWFQIWREGVGDATEGVCGTTPFATVNCGNGLDFATTNALVAFNESELVEIPQGGASGEPDPALVCIPWETQSLAVGSELPTSYLQGWYFMNLQNSEAPFYSSSLGQGYLTVIEALSTNSGIFSGGWDGVAFDNSCFGAFTTADNPGTTP